MTSKKDFIRIGLIFLGAIALYMIMTKYINKDGQEGYENRVDNVQKYGPKMDSQMEVGQVPATSGIERNPQVESMSNIDPMAPPAAIEPSNCAPKQQLSAEDLLPKDENNTWAEVNPRGQGSLEGVNLLEAGHHVGVNTVGQSRRNANYGIRSDPPNPKVKVSVWNESTIEYDNNRRALEIGGDF
jgi:hypothetical protein